MEAGMKFGRNTPSPAQVREAIAQVLESRLKQKKTPLIPAEKEALINAIADDLLGYGPLEQLLRDDSIEQVAVPVAPPARRASAGRSLFPWLSIA